MKKSNKRFPIVQMSGMKPKFVKKYDFLKEVVVSLKNGDLNQSFVFQRRFKKNGKIYIKTHCLFIDIDDPVNLSVLIKDISSIINKIFRKSEDPIIFKNKSFEKYHLYYVNIIINLNIYNYIIDMLKTEYNHPVDTMQNMLKIEGFNKYDPNTKSYVKDTYYGRFDKKEIDSDVLEVLTQITDYNRKLNDVFIDIPQIVEKSRKTKENDNLTKVDVKDMDISDDFKDCIKNYEVVGDITQDDQGYSFYIKTICPLVNRKHKNNRQSIYINENNIVLSCLHPDCKGKLGNSKILIKKKIDFEEEKFSGCEIDFEDEEKSESKEKEVIEIVDIDEEIQKDEEVIEIVNIDEKVMITIGDKQFEEKYLLYGVRNEKECIEKLLNILEGYFVRCDGELWVYNDKNGLWYNNQNNLIYQYFYRFHDYFYIIKKTNKGVEYLSSESYGNDDCCVKRAVSFLSNMLENDEGWYNNIEHTSIGKLLFNDGIYNFETNIFTKGFNRKIVFFNKINYNYEEKVDKEIYDKLFDIFFRDPFKNSEMGDFFANRLARALSGVGYDSDKSFHILKGLFNCGKGLITAGMKQSFGGNVGEINAENFAISKNSNSGDDEKKMGFLVGQFEKRVIFTNELTCNKILDEELIKKISGGGDTINARKLYKDGSGYIPAFQLFIALNGIPKFANVDKPLIQRMNVIDYDFSFVDNPTKDYQKQIDGDLKKKLKNIKYKRAFAQIIMDNYTKTPKRYDFINNNKNILVSQMDQLNAMIKEEFVITDNELDHITKTDIKYWFDKIKRDLIDGTFKKCINNLISMGCIEKKCNNRSHQCRNKKVFCFIKLELEDDEDDCII